MSHTIRNQIFNLPEGTGIGIQSWTPQYIILTQIAGGIRITWSSSAIYETEIYVSVDGGVYSLVTTTGLTIGTYDYIITSGSVFDFKLRYKNDKTILDVPVGFTVIDQTGGIVRLTCDSVINADHYEWWANIASAGYALVSTTVNPTYDHNVGGSTEVKYKVRAKEGTLPVYSSYTSEIDITTVVNPLYSNLGGTGDRTSIITINNTIPLAGSAVIEKTINGLKTYAAEGSGWLLLAAFTVSNSKYCRFDFGTEKIINEIKFYGTTNSQGIWKWQGSHNGIDFTDIGSSFTLDLTMTDISMASNTTAYRYYRLIGVSGVAAGNPYFYEIEFKIA